MLEPIEHASEDELRALQLERLQWSVQHAYAHVGAYRARCDAAGIHLARITGRSDDMLIIRGVNLFPSQIEATLLKIAGLTPHYQLEITREAYLDQLAVHVECLVEIAADGAARGRLERELQHHIKSALGLSARVQVCDPGTIERSAGKARRVVDRRASLGG
jgi:phenylacetate-coenzyme A ligase PaaK-like adenylate-forming protein